MSKGDLTRIRIIEAAIQSVSQFGFEHSSVTTISKLGKVNRGLIVHYFKSVKRLIKESTDRVMEYAVQYSTEYMNSHLETTDLIERYIDSTFNWMRERPHYGLFVLMLITRAQYAKESQDPIFVLFSSGRHRLTEIISAGVKSGLYPAGPIEETAWQIHSMLVGHLIVFLFNPREMDQSKNLAIRSALRLVNHQENIVTENINTL